MFYKHLPSTYKSTYAFYQLFSPFLSFLQHFFTAINQLITCGPIIETGLWLTFFLFVSDVFVYHHPCSLAGKLVISR